MILHCQYLYFKQFNIETLRVSCVKIYHKTQINQMIHQSKSGRSIDHLKQISFCILALVVCRHAGELQGKAPFDSPILRNLRFKRFVKGCMDRWGPN